MKKKICLLINSLDAGGAERAVANLSIDFQKRGYSVTIITMRDAIIYDYKGVLYNFGRLKVTHSKIRAFLMLKSFLEEQRFDVIFNHRVRKFWLKEMFYANYIFKNNRVVYCIHSNKLSNYFPLHKVPLLSKQTIVKDSLIVAVSQTVKKEIQKVMGLESYVISNYAKINTNIKGANLDFKYIIAVGRLEKIKQFDVLIECYKSSKLINENIKLLIFGEGSERTFLQELIDVNNLREDVFLKGFDIDAASYMKSAEALIMTSKNEGFPMVLVEAIELKTPVIAFDFKSGPSEIIVNNTNGILVKNQDKNTMISALNKISDTSFFLKLLDSIKGYQSPFTEDIIVKKWITIIEKK